MIRAVASLLALLLLFGGYVWRYGQYEFTGERPPDEDRPRMAGEADDADDDLKRLEADLKQLRPDLLFVGNSMLDSRVDLAVLDELLAPRRGMLWIKHNSFTADWAVYLRAVQASGVRPKAVVLLFRGRELTFPNFRIAGEKADYLSRILRVYPMPEVNQAAGMNRDGSRALGHRLAMTWQTGVRPRPQDQGPLGRISELALDVASVSGRDDGQLRTAMGQRFAFNRLRPGADDEALAGKLIGNRISENGYETWANFDEAIGPSLLPLLRRECRELGAQLVLVRIRQRPAEGNAVRPEDDLYPDYLRGLEEWCRREGVVYLDISGDSHWREEHYGTGDHLDERFSPEWTRRFWERNGPVIEQAMAGAAAAPALPPPPPAGATPAAP